MNPSQTIIVGTENGNFEITIEEIKKKNSYQAYVKPPEEENFTELENKPSAKDCFDVVIKRILKGNSISSIKNECGNELLSKKDQESILQKYDLSISVK